MVIMDYRELLTEVSIFLRVTLSAEKLSDHAEMCRQKLITRLITREGSPPQAYIDMNGSTSCPKFQTQNSDCYEEFDNSFESYKSKTKTSKAYVNNLYNNLSDANKENTYANEENDSGNCIVFKCQSQEDNMYINPSSPLANTPVIQKSPLPSKPPSNSNSERNSFISLKKDSDTSSYTSSSTRGEESAEVVALSASALRYAASKCGVLGRRERFFFVDHTKQYWVAVVQQSLVMYSTDKDNKPVAIIDITGYQARPVAISNKTDFKFELVAPGNKTYQFVAEKQSDMDKWIEAINAAGKLEETTRQLPSPHPTAAQETYDQPDSAIRPVIVEAEYELPDTVLRSHGVHDSWRTVRRNSEPRQLPSPPQETYDSPEPGARRVPELYECVQEELYHCIEDQQEPQKPKKPLRRLPSLPLEATPQEETYDMPEPTIRPVIQKEIVVQEELYSVIDSQPVIQDPVYKNVEDNVGAQYDDNNYYNVVSSYPEQETEQECIYNVITEQRPMFNSSTEQRPTLNNKITDRPTLNKITEQPTLNNKITEQRPTLNKTTEQRPTLTSSSDNELKKPPISAKPILNSQTDRGKSKEDKKLSYVSNIATIFNKPSAKSQLKEVKPPVINKTCQ